MKIIKYFVVILSILVTIFIIGHSILFCPSLEDPFNLYGRNIYKDYYLYYFREGDMYVLWKKYSPLPGIPFNQAVSCIYQNDIHTIFVFIDNEWYEVDMMNDNIKKVSENTLMQHPIPPHIFYKQL